MRVRPSGAYGCVIGVRALRFMSGLVLPLWRLVRRRWPRRPADHAPRITLHVRLAGTSARSLAWHDRASLEDLATPDTPWLTTSDRTGKALGHDRAGGAELLGALEVRRRLGEPQVRVADAARQLESGVGRGVEQVEHANVGVEMAWKRPSGVERNCCRQHC
jgi:hypothetical protein